MDVAYADKRQFFLTLFLILTAGDELPKTAWLVSKMGRLTAGVQYEPKCKCFRHYYGVPFFNMNLLNIITISHHAITVNSIDFTPFV